MTGGPTHEPLDPVRFLGNHSSGRMGFALAEALAEAGATVTLVTGPSAFETHNNRISVQRVQQASAMQQASAAVFPEADGAVLTAAVADFRPKYQQEQKIKKQDRHTFTLELEPTPDILAQLGAMKQPGQVLVGFSLETEKAIEHAKAKLRNKNLDLIVLNELSQKQSNFGETALSVTLIDRHEAEVTYEAQPKAQVAKIITDCLQQIPKSSVKSPS